LLVGCCIVMLAVALVRVGDKLNNVLIHRLMLGLEKNRLIESLAEAKRVTEELNEELVTEIEERKRTEAALRTSQEEIRNSLKEKDVLLREIHHRVKNNLAVMSSLLRLQSRYAKDGLHRELFDDAQDRIRSMALAHEKLYQSGNVAELNIKRYMSTLIGHLVVSTGRVGNPIKLEEDVEDMSFGIETAVPLGFIVTELVANCLKHAFPGNREGLIRVSLHRTNTAMFELMVCDNGVGLPEAVDLDAPQSFGLDLVGILARQLKGRLNIMRNAGTEVRLTFSAPGK
jgi:two-component sensor histidine kinase